MLITADYSAGKLTIHMAGELDHHSAKCALTDIDRLLDEYMPRDAILDMSALSFMDSAGIALILRTERRMRRAGGRASVENPAQQPLRVLDAAGIDRMIPVRGGLRT